MSLEDSAFGTSSFVDFEPVVPDMQALVLDYLRGHGAMTFVDMEEDIAGFSGELTLRDVSSGNTILWRGLSPAAVHALHVLQRQGKVEFREVSPRVYQTKGRRIQLPVAKTKAGVRRWSPVLVVLKSVCIAEESDAAEIRERAAPAVA